MHAVVAAEGAATVLAIYRSWFCFFVVDFYLLPLRPIINLVVVVSIIPGPMFPNDGVGCGGLVAGVAPKEFRDVHGRRLAA